MCSINIR